MPYTMLEAYTYINVSIALDGIFALPSSPNLYAEALSPSAMAFGGEAVG